MVDSSNNTLEVMLADPKAQFLSNRSEIEAAVARVLESGWYILGKEVDKFEAAFAKYLGASHCIGVANGTDAIAVALRAVGVGTGDEVITVSHSAVATVAAIEQIGAIPVFCDIEEETLALDPQKLETLISPKCRAVVLVHIYGQPGKIEEISEICKRHNLKLIEDCAQAHGAEYRGKIVGTIGDAAAFSFYPTKNLGAIGDGGAVVTSSPEVAQQARILRQYGWKERYISDIAGVNSRLDELQAAILSAKLPALAADNEKRRKIAARYTASISGSLVLSPRSVTGTLHAMHLYVVRSKSRDALKGFLAQQKIHSGFHYPLAIHQQRAYQGRIRGGDKLTVTDKIYKEILTLPMYPELSDAQVEKVCAALRHFCEQNRG